MGAPGPIGGRIRRLRQAHAPKMTQRELAERAGVSVDLISKLEQGARHTALLVTLHRIARALDVNVSDLVDEPVSLEETGTVEADSGVVAIRRAVLARFVRPSGELPSRAEMDRSLSFSWGAYWSGRYDTLGSTLPTLVEAARALHETERSDFTARAAAQAYGLAASTLVHLSQHDLAYLAMDRAVTAAGEADDELYHLALQGWLSWVLLHQTGSLDQAYQVAVTAADDVRRTPLRNDPKGLSVTGSLLLSGAVAAARAEDPDAADVLLTDARHVARRLSEAGFLSRRDYESVFGEAQVAMQAVDIAVVTNRPGHALDLARALTPNVDLPLAARARHLADRAYALVALGKDQEAVETLLDVERLAPHWMRYQTYPRTIIRELIERERRARPRQLRALAGRLGVVA